MPWDNKGSGGGGPWGGGNGGGGGQRPPDIEEMIRKSQDRVKEMIPGGGSFSAKGFIFIIGVVLLLWLASGFYRVQPNQQGVVLTFGKWTNTTEAGLHWHMPYPIETVMTPEVSTIHQISIGFRGAGSGGSNQGQTKSITTESLMLTGDQNIIDINLTVQWKIRDAGEFLFNIRDQEATVRIAAESAVREIVGRTLFDQAVSTGRDEIQIKVLFLLQELLDQYKAGVLITEIQLQSIQPPQAVIDAFDDVQRSLQDKDRARNEAEKYRNDAIPRARGDALRVVQAAEAYKESLENKATGEADRFLSVFREYKQNPEVTKRRMYIETMQKVLKNTDKVILGAEQGGVVPYLPLDQLRKNSQ
ncbi:MAG: FtsH protease activity modulator HflK [Halopseudomonas aestusnigri]